MWLLQLLLLRASQTLRLGESCCRCSAAWSGGSSCGTVVQYPASLLLFSVPRCSNWPECGASPQSPWAVQSQREQSNSTLNNSSRKPLEPFVRQECRIALLCSKPVSACIASQGLNSQTIHTHGKRSFGPSPSLVPRHGSNKEIEKFFGSESRCFSQSSWKAYDAGRLAAPQFSRFGRGQQKRMLIRRVLQMRGLHGAVAQRSRTLGALE